MARAGTFQSGLARAGDRAKACGTFAQGLSGISIPWVHARHDVVRMGADGTEQCSNACTEPSDGAFLCRYPHLGNIDDDLLIELYL